MLDERIFSIAETPLAEEGIPSRDDSLGKRPRLPRLHRGDGDRSDSPSPTPSPSNDFESAIQAAGATAAEEIIAERASTHGSFDENARIWQALQTESLSTAFLNDRQRLAYSMICLKLARLIQNPNIADHWDDIAGYAKLGSEGCE